MSLYRGAEDTVTVHEEELGGLTAITVGFNVSSGQESWHLDYVDVTHMATQQKHIFPCRKWLERDIGSGYAQRRLSLEK